MRNRKKKTTKDDLLYPHMAETKLPRAPLSHSFLCLSFWKVSTEVNVVLVAESYKYSIFPPLPFLSGLVDSPTAPQRLEN